MTDFPSSVVDVFGDWTLVFDYGRYEEIGGGYFWHASLPATQFGAAHLIFRGWADKNAEGFRPFSIRCGYRRDMPRFEPLIERLAELRPYRVDVIGWHWLDDAHLVLAKMIWAEMYLVDK